ncbi:MAG: hypothetical protein J1F02_04110 [Lachnospiraceae bacterium]|nr:hypothetical protein [Lachnospiraceae bacterium]
MKEAVHNIICFAKENVPFYSNLYKDINVANMNLQIESIPTVDKKAIQANGKECLATRYKQYKYQEKLILRRTSGTSGEYLKIFWDRQNENNSHIELWNLRRQYYGIMPQDKFCYFYTTVYKGNHLVIDDNESYICTKTSLGISKKCLTFEFLQEIYQKIYDFDPKWMQIQPSVMHILLNYIIKNQLPVFKNLKYVEFTGEVLLNTLEDNTKSTIGCKIGNLYGSIETNAIAFRNPDKQLVCLESNVHTEILKNNPEDVYGEIVVTSLTNYAMPFIRYRIGDKGKIVFHKGRKQYSEIILEKGRSAEKIVTKEGELPCYLFLKPIEFINEQHGAVIQQFQVVQKEIDKFSVKFVLDSRYKGWESEIKKKFLDYLDNDYLKQCGYEFQCVDYILLNHNGKANFFINEMREEG